MWLLFGDVQTQGTTLHANDGSSHSFCGQVKPLVLFLRFGIVLPNSARYFMHNRELVPGNLEYYQRGKVHRGTPQIQPLFAHGFVYILLMPGQAAGQGVSACS